MVKNGIKIDAKSLKGLEKIKIPEINLNTINAKNLRKEMQQLEKDIAKGAKTIDGEYTNTLNGLRAKLRDLKAEIGQMDFKVDPEGVEDLSQRIKHLNDQVKEMEQDYGTFARNVGNYTESMVDALNEFDGQMDEAVNSIDDDAERIAAEWAKIRQTINEGGSIGIYDIQNTFSIKQLQDELKRVSDEMDNVIGEEEYNDLKKYFDEIKRVSDAFKRFRGQVVLADNQLKTQLTRTINGQTYTWENLTAAVGELEDKLYSLAADGKKNTDEFKNIAKAAAELKTQLRQVDYEIDSMVESSKGINKLVSMTQGFTALAQGAVGIGQLFGMDSDNAMKGIQTMTALQGIASALQTVQEQIRQGTAFGKAMENMINYFKTFSLWSLLSSDRYKEFVKVVTQPFKIPQDIGEALRKDFESGKEWVERQANTIRKSKTLMTEYLVLMKKIMDYGGEINNMGIAGLYESIFNLKIDNKIDESQFTELYEQINKFRDITDDMIPKDWKQKFMQNFIFALDMAKDKLIETKNYLFNLTNVANITKKAFNGLGKAIKTFVNGTIILAAFQILLEIIGWVTELIGKTYEWVKGNDKLVNSLNKVETEIDLVNKALERYNSKLSSLKNSGAINDVDELALRYEKLQIEILKSALALQDFVKARKSAKSLEEGTKTDDYTWFGKASDIENISDATERLKRFKEVYFELQAAVEAGNDETGKRDKDTFNLDIFNWFTSSDAKADFGEMQKQVIQDLQHQINNLDLSKGTDEIKRFYEVLEDPMYASAIANIENLYPEEEWAQVLKKRLEQVQSMYDQITETAKESADAELAYNEKLYEERMQRLEGENERRRRIRNNLTEAIEDEYERELQALYNAEADEIEAARKQGTEMLKINADKVDVEKAVEEEILSIQKKYRRMETEMLKKHQEDKKEEIEKSEWDITDILRRIRDNRLSAEDESLKKHLQELENERQDAIEDAYKEAEEAAKEGHNLQEVYEQLVLSINIKYDALVKKEKEQYYQDLLDMYEDYANAMKDIESQMNADRLETKSADVDINYNMNVNSSSGSYDFNGNYIQEEKKFNQERLKLELDYLEQKKNLEEEYAELDKNDSLNEERKRYEESLKELEQFKKDGKATEEEYNDLVEKENELHQQQLVQINTKYNNDLTTINNQYLNDRKVQISQSLAENASLYQSYVDEVDKIMSNVGKEKNVFGIVDLKASIAQIDEAKDKVAEGVNAINEELDNLERKRKSGQISFIDYKQAKEELLKTKETIEEQGQQINEVLKTLLTDIMSQWKGMIDSWVSQVGSLLTTMNETQMQLIDNQLAEIEHQLEIQEEAYERAEEAAEAHKEKMEGIEGELESARGERRLFLLEQLTAQQLAYEKDYAAQQKAAKQKEALEKKQEALEKKRNEQEKKSKVQQAIINTYTAVSNALAVQPWFLGLALSAVALALGLKNVSAIKSTPVYADGGVIQGASHSQGGVKVLGGQAEVEGGEFITNKVTTAKNVDVLTFINSKKKKLDLGDFAEYFATTKSYTKAPKTIFAEGGQLPNMAAPEIDLREINNIANQDNRPIYVSVTEIENVQNRVRNVRAVAGLDY